MEADYGFIAEYEELDIALVLGAIRGYEYFLAAANRFGLSEKDALYRSEWLRHYDDYYIRQIAIEVAWGLDNLNL